MTLTSGDDMPEDEKYLKMAGRRGGCDEQVIDCHQAHHQIPFKHARPH